MLKQVLDCRMMLVSKLYVAGQDFGVTQSYGLHFRCFTSIWGHYVYVRGQDVHVVGYALLKVQGYCLMWLGRKLV